MKSYAHNTLQLNTYDPDIFGFQGYLDTRKIKEANSFGRAEHMVLTEFALNSKHVGLIVINAGFITDFASVPRLPFAYWLTGDAAQMSATVHDKLCKDYFATKGEAISWSLAAKVFHEAMGYEGVPWWRRRMMYTGVRSYGLVTFK